MISEFFYIGRILLALLCGFFIGVERKSRFKDAGVRTHCVVAVASALMMIISKYGFYDLVGFPGFVSADPSRIASQIVSGIGFLGAGMIFIHKSSVRGLTTASGIWATAGIGMAIGARMYILGVGATIIILIAQKILHLNFGILKRHELQELKIYGIDDKDYFEELTCLFAGNDISVNGKKIKKSDSGIYDVSYTLEVPVSVKDTDIINFIKYSCEIDNNQ